MAWSFLKPDNWDAPRKDAPRKARRSEGYWRGGDKFTTRDALASLLAAVADGLDTKAGRTPETTSLLSQMRYQALDDKKEAAKAAAKVNAENEQRRIIAEQLIERNVDPDVAWTLSGDPTAVRDILGQGYKIPDEVSRAQYFINNPGTLKSVAGVSDVLSPILRRQLDGSEQVLSRSELFNVTGPGFPGGTSPQDADPRQGQPLTQQELREWGLSNGGPSRLGAGGFRGP